MHQKEPVISSITQQNGYLYVQYDSGLSVPVFLYGPAKDAWDNKEALDVPFVEDWPTYVMSVPMAYAPLGMIEPGMVSGGLDPNDFKGQVRPPGSIRPWPQAVYRGWPLYVLSGEQNPKKVHGHQQGHQFTFVQVAANIEEGPISQPIAAGVRTPPISCGP